MNKNILILTASIGHGHRSAARATFKAIEKIGDKRINVEILDFISFCSPILDTIMQKNYNYASTYAPQVQKFIYEITNKKSRVKILNLLLEKAFSRNIEELVKEKKPEIIISTFPLWDYAIEKISKKIRKDSYFFSIITDAISVHKSWILADTDFFFVSNEDTQNSLIGMGVKKEKIKNFGFPVDMKFREKVSRENVLQGFGLNPKNFTVVFYGNFVSQGAFSYIKNIQKHLPNLNFVILTGRDKNLLEKLNNSKAKNLIAFGWRDDIPEIIKSADVVVTKAGGASVMESIAAETPLLLTRVIPGQEEGNLILVQKNNLGLASFDQDLTKYVLERWSQRGEDFLEIKKNLKRFSRPKAAEKIAEFVIKEVLR